MSILIKTCLIIIGAAVFVIGEEVVWAAPDSEPPGWPLVMSTYLGGSGQEGSNEFPYYLDAVVDSQGNVIIATMTTSTDLPVVSGSYQCTTCGGMDILIARLSADLTRILGLAKIGGNGTETYPQIALGMSGRVYLLVRTSSNNYPTTTGAYSRTRRGTYDFAITAFDSLLSTVLASTYFGGNGTEDFPDLVINASGEVYISGSVGSSGVPTTAGAAQQAYGGGGADCFVSKFSPDLDALMASTLLGGISYEESGDLGLLPSGDVVIGLGTLSNDFPTTPGAYDRSYNDSPPVPEENRLDCALTRLNSELTTIVASTYIGGGDYDMVSGIEIDDDGNVWFAGSTWSIEYPVSPTAFDPVHNPYPQHEEFVSKMNGDLSQLLVGTFLSPNFAMGGVPQINYILVDTSGLVYITGLAWDSVFMTPDAYDPTYNGEPTDYFFMVLSNDLSQAVYSTFIGGTDFETDSKTASIQNGIATIAGITRSNDYPTTSNALYPDFIGGATDITVTRLGIGSRSYTCGDANNDTMVDVGDAVYLINYVFKGGPEPNPKVAGNVNCDADVNVGDAVYLINYVFKGGPAACASCF